MQLKPNVQNILETPPVGWESIADGMDAPALDQLSQDLTAAAEYFTRVAAYFDARSLGRAHNAAVKVTQRKVTACRKAFGFSYPKDTLSF